MGLNDTPSGERLHIGFFGCRNAGKSSLVNAVTGQKISVVSDTPGTTTDPVKKAMELLPLGPVLIIDTPGYDDVGELGEKRIEGTKTILRKCDIAVLVTEAGREYNKIENELINIFETGAIPYIVVKNKSDLLDNIPENTGGVIYTSAELFTGIENLKSALSKAVKTEKTDLKLVGDLIRKNDFVVLVTPIDSSAPKGRIILPQQQVIRDILDQNAVCIVTSEFELKATLNNLGVSPALVITDSQVFEQVAEIVPESIPLTSFSILMARYKGFLDAALKGAIAIDSLENDAKILISEGCTHHRQCEDIGAVKLPNWLKSYTEKNLHFDFTSGGSFSDDLTDYDLVIHCGGCMLNKREMLHRMYDAEEQDVPFTNYGIAIAHMKGILERSTRMLIG